MCGTNNEGQVRCPGDIVQLKDLSSARAGANMDNAEEIDGNSDICECGHNIQEHEAVGECKCYVYGCECGGFSPQ